MEKLLEILEDLKPGFDFEGRTDLATSGDLDSFDIISLVSELDEAFDIEIPVEAIEPENFDSLESMMELIQSLS